MLMKSAFDLAVSLRSCCAEYDWSQTVPPHSLNKKDIKRICDYDIVTKGPTSQPMEVLLGPVYKQVNGMPAVLRSGTVLYGQ